MLDFLVHTIWTSRHRRLALLLLSAILAMSAYAWFSLRPRWNACDLLRSQVGRLEQEACKAPWPHHPLILKQLLEESQARLLGDPQGKAFPGLRQQEKLVQERATRFLKQKILETFPPNADENEWMTLAAFMQRSSRIDFKYLANRLEAVLADQDLRLPEDIVQITEPSPDPVYQRILQLWLVEFILQHLADHQLTIQKTGDQGIARIHLLPPRGYTLKENQTAPYLWEFPLQVTVRGTVQNFLRFQASMMTRSVFFPVRNLSVYTPPPSQIPPRASQLDLTEQSITFTISSFFLPSPLEDCQKTHASSQD